MERKICSDAHSEQQQQPKPHLFDVLMQAELDFVTPPWPKISAAAKDCVRQLLNVQVHSRPSASELLQVDISTSSTFKSRHTCHSSALYAVRNSSGSTRPGLLTSIQHQANTGLPVLCNHAGCKAPTSTVRD